MLWCCFVASICHIYFQLYDLHIGEVGESKNTKDGCPGEEGSCSSCPTNSTCVGSFGNEHTCVCDPGLRGANCDEGMVSFLVGSVRVTLMEYSVSE